jgi:hypothetical protein
MSMQKGSVVWNREKTEKGFATGSTRECSMSCCRGTKHGVKWSDGKTTYPCGKGMKFDRDSGEWQIR